MTTWEAWVEHGGKAGRPTMLVNRESKEAARRAFAFMLDVPVAAVKVRVLP